MKQVGIYMDKKNYRQADAVLPINTNNALTRSLIRSQIMLLWWWVDSC
jgi:hypothetical protein